jgi:fatty-acyl-CoA synthase
MYTSGTTGRPKGAVLTNGSILRTDLDRDPSLEPEWARWAEDDVGLVAMPCFHISGTGYGIQVMANGATGVITREFDPHQVLDLIECYGISKLFLVPAAMKIVLDHPRVREVDFSRLRNISYGASPIPLELLRTAIEVFGCGFVQMYGMTETSGTICALPPEDHDPGGNPRMRSVGKPLRGVEMKVIDGAGEALPPREIGEIAIRTQATMREYWQRPEATAETIDGDGWLRTGDAGYTDEDGYFYLHDRVKDMIISGGENVYPAEVENAIYGHPAVADVAVIGIPDPRWGEAVKACVVLKPGAAADPNAIIAWARERIAGYKCPKSVDFLPALPRNPSGKVLRRELRAPYWEGHQRQIA